MNARQGADKCGPQQLSPGAACPRCTNRVANPPIKPARVLDGQLTLEGVVHRSISTHTTDQPSIGMLKQKGKWLVCSLQRCGFREPLPVVFHLRAAGTPQLPGFGSEDIEMGEKT